MQVPLGRAVCINDKHEGCGQLNVAHQICSSAIEEPPIPIAILDTTSFKVVSANEAFYQLCTNAAANIYIDVLLGKQWVLEAKEILVRQCNVRWVTRSTIGSGSTGQEYLVNATVIVDTEDGRKSLVVSIKDAAASSEKRMAEPILNSPMLQLSRFNTVGEMTTMLAHELNQPLTAILNYTDTCRHLLKGDSYSVDEVDGALVEIENMTHRTSHTLDRIRKMVGRKATAMHATSPNSLVEDSMCVAEYKLRMSIISVDINLADNLPMVFVDAIQIQQVILNLLINAIDAMEHDDAPIESRLVISTCQLNDREIGILVTDNGPGIDVDVNGKLFVPFVSTKIGGLGVGLSICKTLMDAHGGGISIESNPTRGVTAKITFPVKESK